MDRRPARPQPYSLCSATSPVARPTAMSCTVTPARAWATLAGGWQGLRLQRDPGACMLALSSQLVQTSLSVPMRAEMALEPARHTKWLSWIGSEDDRPPLPARHTAHLPSANTTACRMTTNGIAQGGRQQLCMDCTQVRACLPGLCARLRTSASRPSQQIQKSCTTYQQPQHRGIVQSHDAGLCCAARGR